MDETVPVLPFSSPSGFGRPADVQDFLHDPVGCMSRLARTYGNIAVFGSSEAPLAFVFGPEYNQRVFGDPESFHILARFPGPKRSAQRRIARGMFSMNGEEHRQARRRLMPPFRKEVMGSYIAPFTETIAGLVDEWRPGQTFDLIRQMKELTLRITTRVLFGVEVEGPAHFIADRFEDWLELNHLTAFSSLLQIERPAGCYEALIDTAERMEQAVHELVAGPRRQTDGDESVLGVLLQACSAGAIDREELIGQTITIFNAAYHTTTYALTWTQFLLAQHPSIMRQLDAELQMLPTDRAPRVDEVASLSLLDRVVKESLRMLPSVVYLPRITTRPVELGPHALPAGATVLASPYVSHHLPDVFLDPQRFDPDRWFASPAPWSYIPFGAGARLCLGAPFAGLLIKLTLAQTLRKFRLQIVPGSRIDRHGTLSLGAQQGVPVELHPPDGKFAASPVSGQIHEMVDLVEMPHKAARAA